MIEYVVTLDGRERIELIKALSLAAKAFLSGTTEDVSLDWEVIERILSQLEDR